jgi:transposase
VVAIDCAKASSRWRLANFYGRILIPPTTLANRRADFDAAIAAIAQARTQHRLQDLVVAVERTGRYHLHVKRAFAEAGFDVRIVDPLATYQYRKPAHAGTKTDDIDLEAIHKAVIHGFGLLVPEAPAELIRIKQWARHRRDLVAKTSRLRCQIRDYLHLIMPGFAELFDDLFESRVALFVARHYAGARAIRQAGLDGLTAAVAEAGVRCHRDTLVTIAAWAQKALDGDDPLAACALIVADLIDDFQAKRSRITAVEVALVGELVKTSYLLLLSIPGVNVTTAAELAGELGPINAYASARAITGRAGLYPSRYQSGPVDHADGPLVSRGNRRLRAAILRIADTLLRCNEHFALLGRAWEQAGVAKATLRVRIGSRFCRIAFALLASGRTYQHPSSCQRDYILKKLMTFYHEHNVGISATLTDLQTAVIHLPPATCVAELAPLEEEQAQAAGKRGTAAQRLNAIVPPVLESLRRLTVESGPSGESSLSR